MKKLIVLCVFVSFFSCKKDRDDFVEDCTIHNNIFALDNKINGGSILQTWMFATSDYGAKEKTSIAQKTNANWICLSPLIAIQDRSEQFSPFKYEFPISAEVAKMKTIIPKMKNSGLNNIMLKPLTSFSLVDRSSFWGDFYVTTEEEWVVIEKTYAELLYEFAKLSEEFPEVKLLSIGNELKGFTSRRPQFFRALIAKIREDFPNLKLTYAANWDEYESVSFWEDLDFIGVNSYFTLVNKKTPITGEVKEALFPIKNDLNILACTFNKPILFTEYGYRSVDYNTWKIWLLGHSVTNINYNFEAQSNAYKAFYETFWGEDWVAGGFFWEWKVLLDRQVNNPKENGWYVNDKPVEKIIRERYAK